MGPARHPQGPWVQLGRALALLQTCQLHKPVKGTSPEASFWWVPSPRTESSPPASPCQAVCELYAQTVSLTVVKRLQQFQPLNLTAHVPTGATPAIQ